MLMTMILQTGPPGAPGAEVLPGQPDGTLETVGLALLAYGLVQVLSRVLDKVLTARAEQPAPAASAPANGGFRDEDRRRLEKSFEMLTAERDKLARLTEAVAAIQDQTRWLGEQRGRTDPADGQPLMHCRARAMVEQLNTQQRLVGQALDELRTLNRQNETVLRKLRAVWRRISRWRPGG
jgi:small-conductance mechanosensitive channel